MPMVHKGSKQSRGRKDALGRRLSKRSLAAMRENAAKARAALARKRKLLKHYEDKLTIHAQNYGLSKSVIKRLAIQKRENFIPPVNQPVTNLVSTKEIPKPNFKPGYPDINCGLRPENLPMNLSYKRQDQYWKVGV